MLRHGQGKRRSERVGKEIEKFRNEKEYWARPEMKKEKIEKSRTKKRTWEGIVRERKEKMLKKRGWMSIGFSYYRVDGMSNRSSSAFGICSL